MTEQLTYHSVESLRALPTETLMALWELVPTDRQKSYKTAYDGEIRAAGAEGSDALERQLAGELQRRYLENGLVPLGSRWARTPTRVQEAAQRNDGLEANIDTGKARPHSGRLLALGGAVLLLFVGVLISRLNSSNTEIDSTTTPTPSATPTARISPTPTPLALEEQDAVIQAGDAARAVAYPVSLQIVTTEGAVPRVWVVQRRTVRAAEWNFDPNPDTASFLSGLAVRPVLGIPDAPDNAALFRELDAGAVFTITLNTGAILRYEFASKRLVRRSDTSIFRQVGPGLVLLLIGERDAGGLPTETRTLVMASYPAEQELSRSGELMGANLLPPAEPTLVPTPTAVPPRFSQTHVEIIAITRTEGQIVTQLRLYNGGVDTLHLKPDDIWLALGYAPQPPGPRVPAEGLIDIDLLPEQAVDLKLVWAWADEPYAVLTVGDWQYSVALTN